MFYPMIIQGGMGVHVSCPGLARAVSMYSQPRRETLGTGSGTAIERVMARLLQRGGEKADDIVRMIRGSEIPEIREMGERIIEKYLNKPKSGIPVFTLQPPPSRFLIELTICANYVFVMLSKEGHINPVSMNYLEKIQAPHVFAVYGAMLAGVDFITVGAGIPLQFPDIFDAYMEGREATYSITVHGGEDYVMRFNPQTFFGRIIPMATKPRFIPIIASNTLATLLVVKKNLRGRIYGLVVEEPTAGGHNAPPRDKVAYGPRDLVDYSKLKDLGIPFWIGGSKASPDGLSRALSLGAKGIQAGTIFAFCDDSGMHPEIRRIARRLGYNGTAKVVTDRLASPTGYPFKVLQVGGTASENDVYMERTRICDQGALVEYYYRPDGTIGQRCPSEPVDAYIKKGGKLDDTIGRKCVCNGLVTTGNLRHDGETHEPFLVTSGDDMECFKHLMSGEDDTYGAKRALDYLFQGTPLLP
jgi:nitronate monooxygenase